MKPLTLIALVALVLVVLMPVTAQTMSFIDVGFGEKQDVLVYANGTLLGQYNTSSPNIDVPAMDFQVLVQPSSTNVLEDPGTFLTSGFGFVETNILALVAISFILGMFVRGLK
jgi:hypothetical protein